MNKNIDEINAINNYYREVSKFFESEKLSSLSDNEYKYKGLNVLEILSLEKVNSKFKKFNKFKTIDDIINCNNDLRFFTANLFLYKSYINNPLQEQIHFNDKKYYTYKQNGYDWIYSMYISCCFEKLYNFWDRIGDLLAYYLDLNLNETQVYFDKVIRALDETGRFNNENLEYLKNFHRNTYQKLNTHRKEIVHYSQYEATFKNNFSTAFNNEEEIIKIYNDKLNMPDYFKNHLNYRVKAFIIHFYY